MTAPKLPIAAQPAVASKPGHARRRHLNIIEPLRVPTNFELLAGVPPTRAQCPDTSSGPCPYVSCRYHLWLLEQRDRAGNPARGAQGEAAFRASTNETCALDVAESAPASFEEISTMLGVDHTRVRQIEEVARAKWRARLVAKFIAQGVTANDAEELADAGIAAAIRQGSASRT